MQTTTMNLGPVMFSLVHGHQVRYLRTEWDGMVRVADLAGNELPDLVHQTQLS
jgi:hypothetical protein